MIIEKKGKVYIVKESASKWAVKTENGKLHVTYEVPKTLCPSEEDLRKYIEQDDIIFKVSDSGTEE